MRSVTTGLHQRTLGTGTTEQWVKSAGRMDTQYPANGLAEPNLATGPDSSAG